MSVLIIAEAGVNHNGSRELAHQLVEVAANAGADVVKFQTFVPELVVTCHAGQAEYQTRNIGKAQSQLDMIRALALDAAAHAELAQHCQQRGIAYLSTPFDLPSLQQVLNLGVRWLKIPSGEITHYALIKAIARTRLPILLSTGMSTLADIRAALAVIEQERHTLSDVTVLQCNTEYPTPYEDANLRVIPTLAEQLGVATGYSDHTLGIEAAIAAVALGACVIEKHFTLDQQLPGPDHRASLDPAGLRALVSAIRHVELALGSSTKQVTPSEQKNQLIARKFLVAAQPIAVGELLSDTNVIAKRTGKPGLSPMCWPALLGKPSSRAYQPDDALDETLDDVAGQPDPA